MSVAPPLTDHHRIDDISVAEAYAAFPTTERAALLELRKLILTTAQDTDGVGPVQETLKWGQPAYLTPETRSGTTLRLGAPDAGHVAICAHCQTTVISEFADHFRGVGAVEGRRAVHFKADDPLPVEALRLMIRHALTYHLPRARKGGP